MKNFRLHAFLLTSGLLTLSPLCFGMNTQSEQVNNLQTNANLENKKIENTPANYQEKLETNKIANNQNGSVSTQERKEH
jgi:hypothetical protein